MTGWAVTTLKSATMAGLDVPDITFRKAIRFLDGVRDPNNEGYGYTGPGSTPTMSAVGLLCRQYLQGWDSKDPHMIKGIKNNLKTAMPPAGSKPVNMYYYYATRVMHHFGGEEWKDWNERMRDSLVKARDQSGSPMHKGSWDPMGDPHAGVGGRLMYTSLSLMTLEEAARQLEPEKRLLEREAERRVARQKEQAAREEAHRETLLKAAEQKAAAEREARRNEEERKKTPAYREEQAARILKVAQSHYNLGSPQRACERLREIIRVYPETPTARRARALLKEWDS